jgi:hypothetical protein
VWLPLQTWYLFPGRVNRAPRRAKTVARSARPDWLEGSQRPPGGSPGEVGRAQGRRWPPMPCRSLAGSVPGRPRGSGPAWQRGHVARAQPGSVPVSVPLPARRAGVSRRESVLPRTGRVQCGLGLPVRCQGDHPVTWPAGRMPSPLDSPLIYTPSSRAPFGSAAVPSQSLACGARGSPTWIRAYE